MQVSENRFAESHRARFNNHCRVPGYEHGGGSLLALLILLIATGSSKATDGLQELINDAGGALHFPKGIYKITDTLLISETDAGSG